VSAIPRVSVCDAHGLRCNEADCRACRCERESAVPCSAAMQMKGKTRENSSWRDRRRDAGFERICKVRRPPFCAKASVVRFQEEGKRLWALID